MAATKYSYTTADDFPAGKVNPSRLREEIAASSIVTALDRIDTSGGTLSQGVVTGGTCDVWFKDSLSAGDRTTLDGNTSDPAGGLIASHDSSPSVDPPSTYIVNDDAARTVWNQPQTSNKTPIFNPDIIPPGYLLYITGAFDDITNELAGAGDQMQVSATYDGGPTLAHCQGQFLVHQYVVGGEFGCHNEGFGDWGSMMAFAPASSPTHASGGDGNTNKVCVLPFDNLSGVFQAGEVVVGGTSSHTAVIIATPTSTAMQVAHIGSGAFQNNEQITGQTSGATADVDAPLGVVSMFVPAPSDDGYWTVDGSTLWKGEINKDLVPVPSQTSPQTGMWNWDPAADPSLTPVANPGAPDGAYDLYDTQMPLVRQANRISMFLHEKGCCPPNVRGKKFLPHWKMQFTVNRATAGTVEAAFSMKFGRTTTANASDTIA